MIQPWPEKGTRLYQLVRLRVVFAARMDASTGRVPVWAGLDTTPGAWEAWRIAVVGIAGERGLYDLLVPAEDADIKIERESNRNLWFLPARATGSPAVGIVREFEGRTGSPDGRGAWRKLHETYGRLSDEQKPQQLLRAELLLAATVCGGPGGAANFLVKLGELWALFESLGCCALHTAVCILYSVGFTKPNLHL